nr:NADH-quinone oxidoreductase subunit L [Klebsiella pneumoniae]
MVPCLGLRLVIRQGVRKTIPWYCWLLKRDPLNSLMNIPAILSRFAGKGLLVSENGYLRWYVASMSIGAVVVLALLMVLR